MKLIVDNSFTEIEDPTGEAYSAIKSGLTYEDQEAVTEINALFGKMNYAKSRGNRPLYNRCKGRLHYLNKIKTVCWLRGNKFPTGHLNIVKDILSVIGADFITVYKNERPEKSAILRWNNEPFEMRYYQKEAVEKAVESGRGVVESAVGTGKSLIMANIIKQISVTTLIIVPSRGLLEQMYRDLVVWFGKANVDMLNTTKVRDGKANKKQIRITTIQTVASLVKTGEGDALLSDVQALFMDEFHHAGSSSYTQLLEHINGIYYRYGFTGTFLRNDSKLLDLFGVLSNILYTYPAHKAISEGYLTPVDIIVYNLKGKANKQYQKEYDLNYCDNRELNISILDIVENNKGQILILVDKKEKSGQKIKDYLWCHGIEASYICGDNKKEEIYEAIEDFNNLETRILIGSKVIGEGIDIRSTDHLIMANGGKSEIAIVQAAGRAIRLYPGKKVASIHDFNFINTNYLHKHFNARQTIYDRNFKPTFGGISGEQREDL